MQSTKRILLSCYACRPGFGTEPGFGWNWALSLSKLGYHITVITRIDNKPFIDFEKDVLSTQNINFVYVDLPIYVSKVRPTSGLHYALWQVVAFAKAKNLHRKQSFQLVHHVTYGSIQGGSWMWMLKIPLVFGPAGGGQVAPVSMRRYFGKSWRKEQLRTLATKLLLASPFHYALARYSKLMLATNTDTFRYMVSLKHQKSKYFLDSGIPAWLLAEDHEQIADDSNVIKLLWVGRLMPRKAIKLALESLTYLKIPYHLTIIGDGEQKPQLIEWIKSLNLTNQVTYRGRLPWEEVMYEYKIHDLFLFTSLRDSFGSQLLESLSQALPVVCLDHQGAAKFVPNDASFKIEISNTINVARSIAHAIEDFSKLSLEQRNVYRKNAIDYARSQTWDNKALQMDQLYREAIER